MEIRRVPEDFKVFEETQEDFRHGDHLIFRMTKANYSTEDAVQAIAKALSIERKKIGYAGSKDSRAITEQNISILGVSRERVESLSIKDITLHYMGKRDHPLSLGDLAGNRFEIVVRKIHSKPENVESMLNLFGHQRFSTDNAKVGKLLVRKDFKGAVEVMLQHPGRQEEVMRSHLEKNKNDFVGALKTLPWKTLQLYIHSYQSLIWNACAPEVDNLNLQMLPIVGFATDLSGASGDIIRREMQREGIDQQDFVIRAIPDLSSAGAERRVRVPIIDFQADELQDDEFNPGFKKVTVRFRLGKGSYATQVLETIFHH